MDIYVIRNGNRSGPFTPYQIRAKLGRGTIDVSDLIWFAGLQDPIPARSAAERIEFSKATEEQKDAIRFLGHRVERGLMFLDAEAFIQRVAVEKNKTAELRTWQRFNSKMRIVREWWQNQETYGVPGGIIALGEELGNVQRSSPQLFDSITPEQLVQRIPHFIRDGWRSEPATPAQLRLLRQHQVRVPPNITKGEASDRIDAIVNQVTEGQRRRLSFYKLPIPQTKDEACFMIDNFIAQHPEAEAQYQRWKMDEIKAHPPIGMTADEWEQTLNWVSKQHTEVTMALPDDVPGAEPASLKQLQYIRHAVLAIDEALLNRLTKTQACVLIERIGQEKKAFNRRKADEVVRTRPGRRFSEMRTQSGRPSFGKKHFALVILLAISVASFALYLAANHPSRNESSSFDSAMTSVQSQSSSIAPAMSPMAARQTARTTVEPRQDRPQDSSQFVTLTEPVTLYNSRGRPVKQLAPGKRLRLRRKTGNQLVVTYLDEEYVIPAASAELSH